MTAFTGRSKPGTIVHTLAFVGVVMQLVSTGGTALPGLSTVTASESLLNTRSCVPAAFETTVCALVTAMVVVIDPELKFITSTAPVNEKPLTVADGTAA